MLPRGGEDWGLCHEDLGKDLRVTLEVTLEVTPGGGSGMVFDMDVGRRSPV